VVSVVSVEVQLSLGIELSYWGSIHLQLTHYDDNDDGCDDYHDDDDYDDDDDEDDFDDKDDDVVDDDTVIQHADSNT
jgi:hypothetical protein